MIEDKELDEMMQERQVIKAEPVLDESTTVAQSMHTKFAENVDNVKQVVLQQANEVDVDFKKKVTENIKKAAVTLTEVERDKAEYIQQQVGYESLKLETKEQQEIHQQHEDVWANRQKRREYHYNGVKPLMTFVGIKEPMNLIFLYLFAIVLILPFFVAKLLRGTIGVILSGAEDGNRSKAAKGFLWTVIAIFVTFVFAAAICLFLEWRGVNIFGNII